MARRALKMITREEFDTRLDAFNARRSNELHQTEEEQEGIEQLLAHYEQALSEIEDKLRSEEEMPSYPGLLRKRLLELAKRTAQMAASL